MCPRLVGDWFAVLVSRTGRAGERQSRHCPLWKRGFGPRALGMKNATPHALADNSAVADYKRILQQVLERRPAGTKQRLAERLGKNRSFISQITNAKYSVPIPANHLESIFEGCHFLAAERESFMAAYRRAHPHRAPVGGGGARWRELRLRVPDLRDSKRNKELDELLHETLRRVLRLMHGR